MGGKGNAVARFEEPPPSAFQRWVAAHARGLYAVCAVVTVGCGWWLVGALMSPDTRDVVRAVATTLAWLCLTLQVRVVVRYVARYDRRIADLESPPGVEGGRS